MKQSVVGGQGECSECLALPYCPRQGCIVHVQTKSKIKNAQNRKDLMCNWCSFYQNLVLGIISHGVRFLWGMICPFYPSESEIHMLRYDSFFILFLFLIISWTLKNLTLIRIVWLHYRQCIELFSIGYSCSCHSSKVFYLGVLERRVQPVSGKYQLKHYVPFPTDTKDSKMW